MAELGTSDVRAGLRLAPLHGRATAVHLIAGPDRSPSSGQLALLVEELAEDGIDTIRTSALSPEEAAPFAANGFNVVGRLALLSVELQSGPRPRSSLLRRGRQRDHQRLLGVDERCFPSLWQFDRTLLDDALRATPATRFRIGFDVEPFAYAIAGVAGSMAYLQRLAVDPPRQGHGIGRSLVDDARQWALRRGAATMLVNTAVDNHGALEFYAKLGFERRPTNLCVMERQLRA